MRNGCRRSPRLIEIDHASNGSQTNQRRELNLNSRPAALHQMEKEEKDVKDRKKRKDGDWDGDSERSRRAKRPECERRKKWGRRPVSHVRSHDPVPGGGNGSVSCIRWIDGVRWFGFWIRSYYLRFWTKRFHIGCEIHQLTRPYALGGMGSMN